MKNNIKSIRFSDSLIDDVNRYAEENGLTFSQVINLCVSEKLNLKTHSNKPRKTQTKVKSNLVIANIRLSKDTYEKITKIAKEKEVTISREIRFRLSSSIDNPCFDTLELHELRATRNNLNQVGNLIKMSITNNLLIQDSYVLELQKKLKEIQTEIEKIIMVSVHRIC